MHVQELDEVLGYTTPGTDRYRYPGTRIVPVTVYPRQFTLYTMRVFAVRESNRLGFLSL
jgi:hypothetical protein